MGEKEGEERGGEKEESAEVPPCAPRSRVHIQWPVERGIPDEH
jgi:hypothetical protein